MNEISENVKTIQKILENFPISAWVVDTEGTILYMNYEMTAIFGNLVGENCSIIYPPEVEIVKGPFDIPEEDNIDADIDSTYKEIMLADVPFRRMDVDVDLPGESTLHIELFEDISASKNMQKKMTEALQKIKSETIVAKGIQKSVLPVNDRYWNTVDFASIYLPADDIGGDVFDILKINEDESLIYIADVAGHGIRASLLTIFIREQVRANLHLAEEGTDRLLGRIQGAFLELDIDGMLYITMLICKYNKKNRELSVANAGHNCFPIIDRQDKRIETIPLKGMPICAIGEEDGFEEEIVGIGPGDRLVLYTDGIVEEYDLVRKKVFGPEGVREVIEKNHEYNAATAAKAILDEAAKYMLVNAKDDRTIVVADIIG